VASSSRSNIASSIAWAILAGITTAPRSLHSQDFLEAARLAGLGEVSIDAVARDPENGAWLAGRFPADFDADPGPGVHALLSSTGSAFVIHLAGDGSLLWAGQFDGDQWGVWVHDLAVAPDGSVLLGGTFQSRTDFDPGPGARYLEPPNSLQDGFLAHLTPAGQLRWVGQVGGTGYDAVTSVAVGAAGDWVVGGIFEGTADLDPGPGVESRQSQGHDDIFVLVLDSDGAVARTDVLAAESQSTLNDLAVGSDGAMTLVGSFYEVMDLDPGPSAYLVTSAGSSDGFVARLDALGSFEWGGRLGGPESDSVLEVTTDPLGSTYVAGVFQGTSDLDLDAASEMPHTAIGNSDAFVLALSGVGSTEWVRTARGPGYEVVRAIAGDPAGGVYVAGSISSGSQASFDVRNLHFQLGSGNGSTAFLWHVDRFGGFAWAGAFRPVSIPNESGSAYVWDIAALDDGEILLAGSFESTVDFDPGLTSHELTAGDASDAFIARVRDVVHLPTTVVIPDEGASIQEAIDGSHHFDRILVRSGTYHESIDFRGQHVA
jgi:hypothetical protein